MSKVEQVAKALYIQSGMTNGCARYWRDMALTAIAAMREPTDEMVIALTWPKIRPAHPAWAEAKAEWAQAIDAALSEPTPR